MVLLIILAIINTIMFGAIMYQIKNKKAAIIGGIAFFLVYGVFYLAAPYILTGGIGGVLS